MIPSRAEEFAAERQEIYAVFLFFFRSSIFFVIVVDVWKNEKLGKNQASQLRFSCSASGSPALPTLVRE